ncbi:MAG: class I SAM-dependent methyltransferase [Candidatus Eremiobacteraeota bacterium]|nr:class I SAM-dependent methyltransferase [Candidatus Eremiobacteraeota bacterium]
MTDATVFNFSSLGVAGAYEHYLVPRIFGPWAETLLEALDVRQGEALLDIACGPGTVAKAAARRIGDGGIVVGTDVSPEMLDVARASTPASARVRYECAAAENLPFGPAEFDAITVQQGMQFFPDRPAAIVEMFRVMRPGGRAGVSVWAIDDAAFFAVVRDVLVKAVPAIASMLDRPLVDRATLQAELSAVGFEVASGTLTLPLEFEGIEQAVEAMRGLPMWPTVAAQPAPVRRAILEAARERFSAHLHHGHVQMAMRANVTVARKPAT